MTVQIHSPNGEAPATPNGAMNDPPKDQPATAAAADPAPKPGVTFSKKLGMSAADRAKHNAAASKAAKQTPTSTASPFAAQMAAPSMNAESPNGKPGDAKYRDAVVETRTRGENEVGRVSGLTLLLAVLLTANAIVPLLVGAEDGARVGMAADDQASAVASRPAVSAALALAGLVAVHLLADRPALAWVGVLLPLWIVSVARRRMEI